MNHIKSIVETKIRHYGTNDPSVIASLKNIRILFNDLGDTLGFFSTYKRIRFIHIHSELEESLQRFVCAHELGHAILHPNVNTPFLKKNTYFSINRIEREANKFAVELLLPDSLLCEGMTIYEAARLCGIPEEVAHLKKPL
ncbi:ImmA/IrrE family metallo-endopeptidase [Xylanibacillus composti]|uniref:ImmA/IrrE family metallo-endopeptidase n=1 Tax=Xylanibacillus composti TaxID=1572762 RepID=A0A8J4H0L2_9BACL|nr:ImmA/IrrE family metallo-endopeptidase [Xylanibacillus composti]MDT9723826.1 ImmA/IrrE family metallo-endopeptidase [Xylanibacillus composti]GIQ67396.1 ImmA/IrrE family metallo-endopeptidase [Xylanibacillus composti]